jgi:hypothetical protein
MDMVIAIGWEQGDVEKGRDEVPEERSIAALIPSRQQSSEVNNFNFFSCINYNE